MFLFTSPGRPGDEGHASGAGALGAGINASTDRKAIMFRIPVTYPCPALDPTCLTDNVLSGYDRRKLLPGRTYFRERCSRSGSLSLKARVVATSDFVHGERQVSRVLCRTPCSCAAAKCGHTNVHAPRAEETIAEPARSSAWWRRLRCRSLLRIGSREELSGAARNGR